MCGSQPLTGRAGGGGAGAGHSRACMHGRWGAVQIGLFLFGAEPHCFAGVGKQGHRFYDLSARMYPHNVKCGLWLPVYGLPTVFRSVCLRYSSELKLETRVKKERVTGCLYVPRNPFPFGLVSPQERE